MTNDVLSVVSVAKVKHFDTSFNKSVDKGFKSVLEKKAYSNKSLTRNKSNKMKTVEDKSIGLKEKRINSSQKNIDKKPKLSKKVESNLNKKNDISEKIDKLKKEVNKALKKLKSLSKKGDISEQDINSILDFIDNIDVENLDNNDVNNFESLIKQLETLNVSDTNNFIKNLENIIDLTEKNIDSVLKLDKKTDNKTKVPTIDKVSKNDTKSIEKIDKNINSKETKETKETNETKGTKEKIEKLIGKIESLKEKLNKLSDEGSKDIKVTKEIKPTDEMKITSKDVEVNKTDKNTKVNSSKLENNIKKNSKTGRKSAAKTVSKIDTEGVKTKTEISVGKNIEISKNENTLIRSAKLNNPVSTKNFESNVMKQITNFTKNSIKLSETGSEMVLKLKPNNLGKVSLKLVINKGIVEAEFNVENNSVKQVLESNLIDLRNSLQDKGYDLAGLDVSVNQQDKHNSQDGNENGTSKKQKNEEFLDILDILEDNKTLNNEYSTINTLR
ncbi:flagellar hook-length control protein FliK [Helicovermis profundi]|uniref:Flagellar hook-length control protein-like C-terminal domain-containing protein n=1 Tax=Helicovermis profundi TaxID=3065157 RepID=A0AAU9EPU3_9FIRM|nr:hypothetical protein HLPR_17070 [Clostridia bacterium S502]